MTKKPSAPSDVADKFMLRLPDGMRDRIAAEAEKNHRSMNAEIVARLEESLLAGDLREKVSVVDYDGLRSKDAATIEEAVRQIRKASEMAIAQVASALENQVIQISRELSDEEREAYRDPVQRKKAWEEYKARQKKKLEK